MDWMALSDYWPIGSCLESNRFFLILARSWGVILKPICSSEATAVAVKGLVNLEFFTDLSIYWVDDITDSFSAPD